MCNHKCGHTSRHSCCFPFCVREPETECGHCCPLGRLPLGGPSSQPTLEMRNDMWKCCFLLHGITTGKTLNNARAEIDLSLTQLSLCRHFHTHIQYIMTKYLALYILLQGDGNSTQSTWITIVSAWWFMRTVWKQTHTLGEIATYLYPDSHAQIHRHLSAVLRWAVKCVFTATG